MRNILTEENNKIVLSSKKMSLIDLIETYSCIINKNLVSKKEDLVKI